ncbi:hypothetical protein D3C73_1117700 [compost metagenome]
MRVHAQHLPRHSNFCAPALSALVDRTQYLLLVLALMIVQRRAEAKLRRAAARLVKDADLHIILSKRG